MYIAMYRSVRACSVHWFNLTVNAYQVNKQCYMYIYIRFTASACVIDSSYRLWQLHDILIREQCHADLEL